MTDIRRQHAVDVQLTAIRCGAIYGALAFAGLIAAALVWDVRLALIGALLGAFAAYVNFTLVSANANTFWVSLTMSASIASGFVSGLLLLGHAL